VLAFLQPVVLFGLVAAGIPTLLHLLARRLPPTVTFPAVRYLAETERRQSKRIRLRNLLLLVLRTLVILFVVLAAARPVASVRVGAGHAPTALALVLDNSLSSGVVVEGRRVLDDVVDQARRIVGRLQPDDWLWLVLADGTPRRVGLTEAMEELDRVTVSPRRLDLGLAVRAAAQVVAGEALAAREVVVLSDLQRTALSAGEPIGIPVLVAEPGPEPPNHGLDSARAEPAVWTPGGGGAVYASLGGVGRELIPLRLELAGSVAGRALAAPGDRVGISGRGARAGWFAARVATDPDELRADDEWHLAVRVVPPAAVSVEDGAGPFVAEALGVLREGGRVTTGVGVLLADRPLAGRAIVFPPADPAAVGAVNRALAARGVAVRLTDRRTGDWVLRGDVGPAEGTAVFRRHALEGAGTVLAYVGAEPWLVRDGDVVVVASRLEPEWTALPIGAAFLPFLDLLVNRVAAGEAPVVRGAPGDVVEIPPGPVDVLTPAGAVPIVGDRRVTAPVEPGVYFLRSATRDTVGALEVNHDPRESRLARADARAVRASLGPDARLLSPRALEREVFDGAGRADLSGVLLLLALGLVAAEFLLASSGAHRVEPGVS
jgi:hypothetical protein